MPSAIDSLETERITADSADQRAGRAARLGPGSVRRLWDARDRGRTAARDSSRRSGATVLDIGLGRQSANVQWFERPRDEAVEAALTSWTGSAPSKADS
jgi:ATP-dependent helicase HrpB